MRLVPLLRAVAAATLLGASSAPACPVCDSETGRQVRAGLFNAGFGPHLLLTLLPFPVFLGIVALIHFGLPRPRGRSRPDTPTGHDRTHQS